LHYHVFAIIKISKEYGLFSPSLVDSAILVFLVTGGLEPVRFAILPIGEIAFADVPISKGLFWNRLNFSWATIILGLEIHRETLKVIFVVRLCEPQEVFREYHRDWREQEVKSLQDSTVECYWKGSFLSLSVNLTKKEAHCFALSCFCHYKNFQRIWSVFALSRRFRDFGFFGHRRARTCAFRHPAHRRDRVC